MLDLSIDLQFSEELQSFRYRYLEEQQGSYRTIEHSISLNDAQRFVKELKDTFPNDLLFASVVCQWNIFKLNNKIA